MDQILNIPVNILVQDKDLKDLLEDLLDVVPNPEQWLKTPNEQLGGRRPLDMIEADDEQRQQVHNLIKAVKHGMMT